MIIKSMARKEPSFGQLIEYMADIDKSDEQYNVYQNLFSRKLDDIEQEFLSNAARMAKRKNGNYLYHEILSITKAEKLEHNKQKQILREVAYQYAQQRASQNLIFGTLHDDHDDHLHYHLLISANASGESKRTRLSKAQFDKLKKTMESRVLKHYPELEQKVVINREAGERLSNKGAEQKRRTGKTPQRDELKAKLEAIFAKCDSKEDFFTALNEAGLEFYVRGKTLGVKDLAHDRNHRLKTLGLLDAFHSLSDRIELDETAKAEAKPDKQEKPKTEQAKPKQTQQEQPTQKQKKPESETSNQASSEPDAESDQLKQQQAKRKAEMDEIRKKQQAGDTQDNKEDKQ